MSSQRVSARVLFFCGPVLAWAVSCGDSNQSNDAGTPPSGNSGNSGNSVAGSGASGSGSGATSGSSGTGSTGVSGASAGSSTGSASTGASGGGTGSSSGTGDGGSGAGASGGGSASGSAMADGGSASGGGEADSGGGGDSGIVNDAGKVNSDSGATADGGSSDGGNCAGMAISFNLNVPTAGDPAAQRVMADLAADLPIGNTPRTIEWWAYVLSSSWKGDANTMFEYGDQAVTNGGFGFDFGTNQTTAMGTIDPYTNGTFDNDNQPSGITDPGTDQWIHFALSWDGTAVRAFVNGVQETAKMGGGMLATDRTQLTIGGNPRGAYFNGEIDEFRVWNIARTPTEITGTMHTTLTGTETGLVGYWKFDETTGMTAADSTTTVGHTAHDGTLMSAAGFALPKWIPSTAPITCP